MLDRNKETIVGLDFGVTKKFVVHGPDGRIDFRKCKLPRITGGASPAQKYEQRLEWLLKQGWVVVTEAATIGSSGMEKEKVRDIMLNYPSWQLQTITNHAVKNHRKDNDLKDEGDEQAAKIIYEIAKFGHPQRLHEWRYNALSVKKYKQFFRIHTSARPLDQREYKDEESLCYLSKMPDLKGIEIKKEFEDGSSKTFLLSNYLNTPAVVIPFLLAFDEEGAEDRDHYMEKIIGVSERRIPSFYSRAYIDLVQDVAKDLVMQDIVEDSDMQELAKSLDVQVKDLFTEVRMEEVPEPTRKRAERIVQKILRKFHSLYVAKNFKSKMDLSDSSMDPKHSACS